MINIPSYTIGEEAARFAFEVNIKLNAPNWFIGFTNPSAGPWKKINFLKKNEVIELGRYERDEKRPDVILFNYSKGMSIIIEAKDDINKLISSEQMKKTIAVYNKEKKRILSSALTQNWVTEKKAICIMGLLWATDDKNEIYVMRKIIKKWSYRLDSVVSVAVVKNDQGLVCYGDISLSNNSDIRLHQLLKSLHLKKS